MSSVRTREPVDPSAKRQARGAYRQVLDFAMMLLAVIALALAAIQFRDSREQATKLRDISERISTQSVGAFPNNVDAITRVVGNTRKSIKIMTDLAGYAEYSAPPYFDKYLKAIQEVRQRGRPIELIIYGDTAAKEDLTRQFKLPDGFNELKQKTAFAEFFQTFHPGLRVPSTSDQFLQTVLQREIEIRRTLRDDAGVNFVTAPTIPDMPFFLWLRDGEEAIFSLYNLGNNVREVSFYTNDGNLTRSLEDIFDEVYAKCKSQLGVTAK